MKPLIFDIARASREDGPGLRTVVFFKGCPLHCVWCQNPESQNPEQEEFFDPSNCINCGHCAEGCYSKARVKIGRYYTPSDLIAILLKDRRFYATTGGGITFSGGEPLWHMDYLHEIIKPLKQEGISIIIETSGYFDPELFKSKILPYIDTVYFDLKIMDHERHRLWTGRSNELILENLISLVRMKADILPRIPLIPGYTATKDNLLRIAKFLLSLNLRQCVFLPYNPGGLDKWKKLIRAGKVIPMDLPVAPLNLVDEETWKQYFLDVCRQNLEISPVIQQESFSKDTTNFD